MISTIYEEIVGTGGINFSSWMHVDEFVDEVELASKYRFQELGLAHGQERIPTIKNATSERIHW